MLIAPLAALLGAATFLDRRCTHSTQSLRWSDFRLPRIRCVFMAGSLTVNVRNRASRAFDDAEVSLSARTECLKCLLVSLAFVGCEGDFVAVEFYENRSQLQSGLVGLN